MEDVLIPHCFRQVAFLSNLMDDFTFRIWSCAVVVELL
jgi:hypothetical protein